MKEAPLQPLTLRDPSGRSLTLEHQPDGSVLAAISLSTFLRWSVRVPPEDVARLKEWLDGQT